MCFRLCVYTIYWPKTVSFPEYRRQCSSLPLHPHQQRIFCAGYHWQETVAETHITETALLHLLLEYTKIKSWIYLQSRLNESAFLTLPAQSNRDISYNHNFNTILRDCHSDRRKKLCTVRRMHHHSCTQEDLQYLCLKSMTRYQLMS